MKNTTIEITNCNDCDFVGIDDNEEEYCIFDKQIIERVAVPLKIGAYTLKKNKCYLKHHTVTFKRKTV